MKKAITILAILFTTTIAFGQKVTTNAQGNYIAIKAVEKPATNTGKTFTDTKGVEYPVFVSEKGKLFVIRTSKESGKEYKQYLKVE